MEVHRGMWRKVADNCHEVRGKTLGLIGLGNVGSSLAGNLLRNGIDLTVRDLNPELVAKFVAMGAKSAASPKAMAEQVDVVEIIEIEDLEIDA